MDIFDVAWTYFECLILMIQCLEIQICDEYIDILLLKPRV